MTTISQLCKLHFVKKASGETRHGLFIEGPDGDTAHIHISPYNMKHMVTNQKHVDARVFIEAPEPLDSVIPAGELVEMMFAASKIEGCEMAELDVIFNSNEMVVMLGDKEISRIDFNEDVEEDEDEDVEDEDEVEDTEEV